MSRLRFDVTILAFALASILLAAAPRAARGDDLRAATHVLIERLRKAGRAEATLERSMPDPIAGKTIRVRGLLALEPPDRASLYFPSTRERVTLRADGGEWIQPELRQLLRLGPERAAAARRWWEVLLAANADRFSARRIGVSRFVLAAREGAAADSVWLELDRRGLPSRLELAEDADQRTVYRLSGWRFSRARGRASFTLDPPAGYTVVQVP